MTFALAACAPVSTTAPRAGQTPSQNYPDTLAWQAPVPDLPHQGKLSDLSQWWQQWNDPTLVALLEAAQAASPTLDAAQARLDQANASFQLSQALLGPTVDATLSGNRGRQTTLFGSPIATVTQARLGATWETDLFGQNRALRDAASQRLQGAQAAWHEARVSVAANVANLTLSHRACDATVALLQADVQSRAVTARLAGAQADAGFATVTSATLARSAVAESNARLRLQRASCDLEVKGLVALTGLNEPEVRRQLAVPGQSVTPALTLAVASVPARALAQRPDVFQAERNVASASAELDSAQAERYPRLTLNGAIGQMNLRLGGSSIDLSTWSIGPITLSVPLWDNGRFAANLAGATARYDEAAANYRAKARQAVREVEEALVNLDSARGRTADLQSAATGYQAFFKGTEQRQRQGLTPLSELEDARRTLLSAQSVLIAQQRDTQLAWVALYRAVGGGWVPDTPVLPAKAVATLAKP